MSNEAPLTAQQQAQLRRLVERTHMGSVLHELSVVCREHAAHCKATPSLQAIGEEWERGAVHIDRAINEVGW